MNSKTRTFRFAASTLRLLAMLALVLTSWQSATAETAQEAANGELWNMGVGARTVGPGIYDHTYGARFYATSEAGEYIGECTLGTEPTTAPWFNCRIDVPSDRVSLIWEDLATIPAGYAPVENPIVFDPTTYDTGPHNIGAFFQNEPITSAAVTANVSIVTMQAQHGAFTDACYVLVDFSNEGCDDDKDGTVTFLDVPAGAYTVHQTRDLSGFGTTAHVPDFEITVTGQSTDGWESFETWLTHRSANPQANHVAIQTTENGQSVYDVCYVIVGFSEQGCDDNQDGVVLFLDVPFGSYTVHQTADLGPNREVVDFPIEVSDSGLKNGLLTFTATITLREPTATDIALITRDPGDGHLLTGACYVLADYSIEGCDEDGDGQVMFADIPFGTYTVRQTKAPADYPTITEYEIDVQPATSMEGATIAVPLGFVVKQAPEQNEPETRNVSVILVDSVTHEKVVADVCAEVVGASNVGCDDDLRDGQVDFLDVPEGGPYDLALSNLPAGYQVAPVDDQPEVTIDAGKDTAANQLVFVMLTPPVADTSTEAPPADTWKASVQVMMCEGEMDCFAQGGIVVNISLASGEYLGSCTLSEPYPTPWGVDISTCSVDGMPYNADFVASQDLSTIPAGYVPVENTLTLRVGDLHPGGGDQATFTFFNVREIAASEAPAASGSATLAMTFRGCPEGFNPDTDDFYANCTIPLDAPDAAFLYHGGDGQGGINIAWMDRQDNGAYIFEAGPYTMNISLSGMAPVVRDTYQVVGHDSVNGETYVINLVPGETREVYVFYYYWP